MNPTSRLTSWLNPERVDEPELLDQGLVAPRDILLNLNEMGWINRRFGGIRALTVHLHPQLLAATYPLTLVDIGTGAADIPAAIARWAAQQKREVRIIALDIAAAHLKIAREKTNGLAGIHLLQADAAHLPFALCEVDFFISSLFFHHLTPEQIVALLRSAFASARRGLIISDLTRGQLPLLAFKLIEPFLNPVTRYDGDVSIRRAYTPAEFEGFAQAAGLTNARVYRHFPWRMTLVAYK